MARTADRDIFLKALPEDGEYLPNARAMEAMAWESERYFKVRAVLIEEGVVEKGYGRGGSVRRVLAITASETGSTSATSSSRPSYVPTYENEHALYDPCVKTLQHIWRDEHNLYEWWVAKTAHRGKGEGVQPGRWTRPDLSGISRRKFKHLPGDHIDVWSFEVKPRASFDVLGVYEAAAHSRRATRSYVLYHVETDAGLSESEVFERMQGEANSQRVGLFTFSDPRDWKTWHQWVKAPRNEPDPEVLDDVIGHMLPRFPEREREQILRGLK